MSSNVGAAGTRARSVAERRAVIDAYLELALGTVRARLESGWIDQAHSPLGPRVHVDAVRRRIAEGRRDALIRGRRAMLTIDAVADEYFGSRDTRLALASVNRRARAANDNGGQS
jgi:hypothetical protein